MKLKPCPFCGYEVPVYCTREGAIRCSRCGAIGPYSEDEYDSTKMWNRADNALEDARDQVDLLDAKNEELKDALLDLVGKAKWMIDEFDDGQKICTCCHLDVAGNSEHEPHCLANAILEWEWLLNGEKKS